MAAYEVSEEVYFSPRILILRFADFCYNYYRKRGLE